MSDEKNWYDQDDNQSQDNGQNQYNNNQYNPYGQNGNPYNSNGNPYNNRGYGYTNDPEGTNAKFAKASAVCGLIAAILLVWGGVLSIPLGALGLLFALLSRRKGQPFSRKGRKGFIFSLCGMIFGAIFTTYYAYQIIAAGGPMTYLQRQMEQVYGEDFDVYDYLGMGDSQSLQDYLNQAQTYTN